MKVSFCKLLPALVLLTASLAAQSGPQQIPKAESSGDSPATFRSFTRLVTIQVVAKDRHGRHIQGLKPEDFELFEENADGKDKKEQKIATFQEVHFADLAKRAPPPMKVPAGVYTNAVTLEKNPVPPTIILVDGLNTKLSDQAQVRVQLERIVKAIPKNTPVAIFLLGSRLRLLQDFSTDPELLKLALEKANSSVSAGLVTAHPLDSPNYASAQLENLRGHESDITGAMSPVNAQIEALAELMQSLELAEYKQQMGARVSGTLQSLIDIGHYVAGYPGRKNLLWISSSFPIKLNGLMFQFKVWQDDKGYAKYDAKVTRAATVLSDAKVAVYPINPAGVQPHAV